jgi:hypothetical protein
MFRSSSQPAVPVSDASNIPCREDRRIVCSTVGVNQDPAIDFDAGSELNLEGRQSPDSNEQLADGHLLARGQHHLTAAAQVIEDKSVDGALDRSDAIRRVVLMQEGGQFGAQDARERRSRGVDEGDLGAERPRRRRHFGSDEAGADDGQLRTRSDPVAQFSGIGDGSQDVNVTSTGAVDRKLSRRASGCDHAHVRIDHPPVSKFDCAVREAHDGAPCQQPHVRALIPFGSCQKNVVRTARTEQELFAERGTVVRHPIPVDDREASRKPLGAKFPGRGNASHAAADYRNRARAH